MQAYAPASSIGERPHFKGNEQALHRRKVHGDRFVRKKQDT